MSGRGADGGADDEASADLRANVFTLDDVEYLVVSYPEPAHPALAALTPMERAVMELVRRGLSNALIARQLGTSPRTVANQIAAVLHKLGIGSRYELAAYLGKHSGTGNPASRK